VLRRSYGQYCGLARALDLVGERWALLVVRELVLGPKRFTDLAQGLPGIGTNVLSARLKELEAAGVVGRRRLPPPAASTVYELTERGRALEPALLALGRWGAQSLPPRPTAEPLRSEWLALALRALFVAGAGFEGSVELRLSEGVYAARADNGSLAVVAGPAESPELVVEASNDELLGVLVGALPRATLRVEGDEKALTRFLGSFGFAAAA
jgi:DNA-binding HxlR family transcriptional regulator